MTNWETCVQFHGHACGGLTIGYKAACYAAELLELTFSKNEQVVCIAENDACGVDAVQVITGCTLGKGNLLYRGTGKMAFSFYCRSSGRAVRLMLKPLPEDLDREERRRMILEAPAEQVFAVSTPTRPVPEPARRFANVTCAGCGETVPEHKVRLVDGKPYCLDCFAPYDRGW